MLTGESNGNDLPGPPPIGDLKVADLKLLKLLSWEHISQIVETYASLDIPFKQDPQAFLSHLTERRDAWFVEAGKVGLIYLTDVVPGFSAQANAVFWDRKLSANRREAIKTVLATAFERFELIRVSALAPASNERMIATWKKVGFLPEGQIRKGWLGKEDLLLLGLLREEQQWPTAVMTSLE